MFRRPGGSRTDTDKGRRNGALSWQEWTAMMEELNALSVTVRLLLSILFAGFIAWNGRGSIIPRDCARISWYAWAVR